MAIGLLVLLIPGLRMLNGDPTPLAGWLRIFLGGVLMMIAWRKWRQRPLPQASVEQPKFLAKIDSYRGWKTLLLGVTLSMLNPKNLILTSASPMAIYESKIVAKEKGIALLVFTVIASLSVCVPIVFTTLRRNQAHKILTDLKDWLIANNTSVTVMLLVVFAVLIVGNGLKIVF
jgi:threonine/homoserine/homoserine lactone efflux protein